jgi:hypothetical protein
MKDFILLGNTRIRRGMIKKYKDIGDKSISVRYNTSTYRVESEVFEFDTKEERDKKIQEMDELL